MITFTRRISLLGLLLLAVFAELIQGSSCASYSQGRNEVSGNLKGDVVNIGPNAPIFYYYNAAARSRVKLYLIELGLDKGATLCVSKAESAFRPGPGNALCSEIAYFGSFTFLYLETYDAGCYAIGIYDKLYAQVSLNADTNVGEAVPASALLSDHPKGNCEELGVSPIYNTSKQAFTELAPRSSIKYFYLQKNENEDVNLDIVPAANGVLYVAHIADASFVPKPNYADVQNNFGPLHSDLAIAKAMNTRSCIAVGISSFNFEQYSEGLPLTVSFADLSAPDPGSIVDSPDSAANDGRKKPALGFGVGIAIGLVSGAAIVAFLAVIYVRRSKKYWSSLGATNVPLKSQETELSGEMNREQLSTDQVAVIPAAAPP